jgi:uncharacterized RDD family membrane protein YckC
MSGTMILYTLLELWTIGTPGKWIFGIRIASADGTEPPRIRLALRWLIKWLPLLLFTVTALTNALIGAGAINPIAPDRLVMLLSASQWAGILILLGTLSALLPTRKALHDWLAGTSVYNENDIGPRPMGKGFSVVARDNGSDGR